MNICFFISDATSKGGTERISFQVAKELARCNHHITFISWRERNQKTFFELEPGIQRYNLGQLSGNRLDGTRKLQRLRQCLNENKIDLIIDVDSVLTPYTVVATLGMTIKHVVWEHFNATINLGVKRRDWGRALAARFADASIVLTDEDKNQWLKRFNVRHKIQRIYNPVTVPVQECITPVQDTKIILAVGRLAEQKGFDLLLDAWAKIPSDKKTNTLLRIIGDGPLKAALVRQAQNLGISREVDFFGTTNNIQQQYAKAHAYVLSSRFEGFVLTLTEAMASGLPVISFNCPCGPSELLTEGAGILVDNGNVNALARAIENVLENSDLRNTLARKCLERSRDFTHASIMPQWQQFVEGLK